MMGEVTLDDALARVELDHVLVAVADLSAATREVEARYGLVSTEGGRHPGWGTANRIVPLGDSYLELVAVVDETEAAQSPFGSWVAAVHPTLARPFGWAVRTNELDNVARRLDLTVSAGSRGRPRRPTRALAAGGPRAGHRRTLTPILHRVGTRDATPRPRPGNPPSRHRPDRDVTAQRRRRSPRRLARLWPSSNHDLSRYTRSRENRPHRIGGPDRPPGRSPVNGASSINSETRIPARRRCYAPLCGHVPRGAPIANERQVPRKYVARLGREPERLENSVGAGEEGWKLVRGQRDAVDEHDDGLATHVEHDHPEDRAYY